VLLNLKNEKRKMKNEKLIVILGPTASGKTTLAAHVADRLGGEVISADSRQVYRGMDIGTGKDYGEYIVGGRQVAFHLVDIAEPGEEYNLYRFQEDFTRKKDDIFLRGKVPILCGGTGLYLHAVVKGYLLKKVPVDPAFRSNLFLKDMDELRSMLFNLKIPHNVTDLEDRNRLIRAIEIARSEYRVPEQGQQSLTGKSNRPDERIFVFGIHYEREILRKRITARLEKRLQEGLIDEVNTLLDQGLTAEQLEFYGLEYRYVTWFLTGKLTYQEMFGKLNTAIHQFAKRQMTWFRKMEREGVEIKWIDGMLPLQSKVEIVIGRYRAP
jgi:tRNA dimethylallyltransferase